MKMQWISFLIFLVGCWTFHWLVYFDSLRNFCPTFICHPFQDVENQYDYIIVGAGSAGSVMAYRLSQIEGASVLLVEAGDFGGKLLDIPAALPLLQRSVVDWQYKTVPQKDAFKFINGQSVNWPRGKIVGGSGRLNNMIYHRGHTSDFEGWFPPQFRQNGGDLEAEVLYYFKKGERQIGQFSHDTETHGMKGPLLVDDVPFKSTLAEKLYTSAINLNISVNNPTFGYKIPQTNTQNGARYSTGHFLQDKMHLFPNLRILTNAFVVKVNFLHKFEAKSVTIMRFGLEKTVDAKIAVVLCAGAVNTPKLLQLSGIGPKKVLQKFSVDVIKDLPGVGMNLQDHPATGLDFVTIDKPLELSTWALLHPASVYDYVTNGRGPWCSIQCDAMFFLHTECLKDVSSLANCSENMMKTAPDLQIMALPLGMTTDNGATLYDIIGVKKSILDGFYSKLFGTATVSLVPLVLHPKSRGFVAIKSSDPFDDPIIEPRYLSHPYDVEILANGMNFVLKLVETPSMQELGARVDKRRVPGCEMFAFGTPSYWECYVRHMTLTVYHPVGTAALGSVLDWDFRVRGVNKLYVADASALPSLTSGNPNAAIVMAAEMAADFVKKNAFMSISTSSIENYLSFDDRTQCF